MMRNLLLLIVVACVGQAFAAQTARVIMVKGKVTALKPGARQAVMVKRGMTFPEDTSILTADKSIVRLKFADKSTMNLGPKSKVVVSKLPEKKPNMINLLTGAIKAEVNKKSSKQTSNKMLIKTRSAVMGVRGTKFQAGFNPANGNTSLVTVEGKVAMVKRDTIAKKVVEEAVQEHIVDETAKEAGKETVKKVVAEVAANPEAELEALDKALDASKEVVEVPAGRFSGVSEVAKDSTPTAPTKIAPQQYNALAKSMNYDKKAKEVFTDEKLESEAKLSADAAGAVGQKAGGFVDFNTGIYVPPPKGSKKDNSTGVYVAKDIGKVDEKTGDYIPPKGVKLDAKKGFVVDKKEVAKLASADKKALQKTLKRLESVNEEVKDQVVVNRMTAKEKKAQKPWYKPDYNHLKATVQPYSETLTTKLNGNNSEADFYTKLANLTQMSWTQEWNDRWGTKLALGLVTYKVDDADVSVVEEDVGKNKKMSLGFYYNWSESLHFSADFTEQAFFFVYPSNTTGTVGVTSLDLHYVNLGASYFLWNWRSFGVTVGTNIMLFGDDDLPEDNGQPAEKLDSFGLKGYGTLRYEFRDDMGINATGYMQRITHKADSIEWTRVDLGTAVQFYYTL